MAEKKVVKKPVAKASVKAPVKKAAAKTAVAKKEKVAAVVAAPKAATSKATWSLKIDVLDTAGKVVESMELPKEIFGAKINKPLMAQAVRVYLANQRLGTASTKTRGEVDGSTRKIYRQKGTGRARHGGVRAPIFVKGGIAHGPKPKDYSLSLSKAMKKAALHSSLSAKAKAAEIAVMDGVTKLDTKTKAMAKALAHAGYARKGNMLLVLPEHMEKIYKAVRNLASMKVVSAAQLTTYDVLGAKKIVLMKEAIEALTKEKKNA